MRGALGGIADVAATIGLAAVGRDLLNAGIEAQQSTIRIQALAKSFGEVEGVTAVAAKAAGQFALGNVEAQKSVTDLYGRLRPMGVSLKDIETVFFGVNKAAKQVGLSTYDTSEVLLQLSQALGSGKLQGDELRSIMERMPAVGQAVAKVMGASASEIKKLGSEGKITTEVMIRAAAELNKIQPPPPTPMQEFEKAMKDLRTEMGENLLPILTPLVQGLTGLVKAFAGLPEPIQTAVIALGALAIAAGPIASVITGIGNALYLLGSLKIGALIAGWLPALIVPFTGLLAWLGTTFLPAVLAFFTGPVGWTVLAVAAVVAMAIAFRKPLGDFLLWLWEWGKPVSQFWKTLWDSIVTLATTSLNTLGQGVQLWWTNVQKIWGAIAGFFNDYVIKPIQNGWRTLTQALPKAMEAAAGMVKNAWRGVLQFIADRINAVGRLINRLIVAYNRLPNFGDIPLVPTLSVPAFAKGGYVGAGTLALVGEAGPEYIIPERKMAQASMNYLGGARGSDVIPTTASTAQSTASTSSPTINITTGPVVEFDGGRFVSIEDFERGLRQVSDSVHRGLRTPAGRAGVGVR
jgi:tape measure domain-containing protein